MNCLLFVLVANAGEFVLRHLFHLGRYDVLTIPNQFDADPLKLLRLVYLQSHDQLASNKRVIRDRPRFSARLPHPIHLLSIRHAAPTYHATRCAAASNSTGNKRQASKTVVCPLLLRFGFVINPISAEAVVVVRLMINLDARFSIDQSHRQIKAE